MLKFTELLPLDRFPHLEVPCRTLSITMPALQRATRSSSQEVRTLIRGFQILDFLFVFSFTFIFVLIFFCLSFVNCSHYKQ